ncbi:MepB family protein [Flavobacterium taihuense]|uniref:MepB family protein n=1 Tax=Flavobacterium taihuense TaxID=2857508 RepID=A0ABS6XWZ0_9FLAO|nr:MepB family protein [Flavobacterium taihuense]MBW4360409.1 MepB family protein [Flavobacterium taihuense]
MSLQNQRIKVEELPQDFLFIKKAFQDNGIFEITQPVLEPESAEYGACTFTLNNLKIRFRTAKITPTKTGQFVTLWKRINQGPIQPFDSFDPIDLFIISTRKDNQFGLFIFPKSILITKEIISDKKEGKRAIRVYPPWDSTTSKQAQKTQKWQLDYFLEIQENNLFSIELANLLLTQTE